METEYDDSADNANETPVSGAGAQLRAARDALHRDLPSVAAETRIPLRHLEAIEDGNFESLPSRAYAIGFARTFAKVVGLDPAQITDAVRAELADGSMQRAAPSSAMEPGDPGRLPSSGLAWATALAALVLAVGGFAFYNAYFGAGTQPGSLLAPETTGAPAAPAAIASPTTQAPVTSDEVVLTALEDGIWLRLYEEGGERLIERTLKQGETVLVPGEAVDPRINTGRPDALAITVGGKSVAKLSERATTLSGVAVSADALLARTAATTEIAAAAPTPSNPLIRRPAQRSDPDPAEQREAAPAAADPAPAAAPEVPAGSDAAGSADN